MRFRCGTKDISSEKHRDRSLRGNIDLYPDTLVSVFDTFDIKKNIYIYSITYDGTREIKKLAVASKSVNEQFFSLKKSN